MELLPQPLVSASLIVVASALWVVGFAPVTQAWAQDVDRAEPPLILAPAPDLTPEQVVAAQLAGLQRAADPDAPPDTGMRVVWNFAAPANQEVTGPFERFDAMVRAAPYDALVGHTTHDIAHLKRDPERPIAQALVAVTQNADGAQPPQVAWFIWVLSQSTEGDTAGCWVTDAVYPVEVEDHPADPSGPGSIV